jgi:hypothetical protein
MGEVESCQERRPRATHGAVAEEARTESRVRNKDREQRMDLNMEVLISRSPRMGESDSVAEDDKAERSDYQ